MNEKLTKVLSDEAFVKSCLEAENEEAVQKLFADEGVEISMAEIESLKDAISAVADGRISEEQFETLRNGGALSDEELEQVAGGDAYIAGANAIFFGTLAIVCVGYCNTSP